MSARYKFSNACLSSNVMFQLTVQLNFHNFETAAEVAAKMQLDAVVQQAHEKDLKIAESIEVCV